MDGWRKQKRPLEGAPNGETIWAGLWITMPVYLFYHNERQKTTRKAGGCVGTDDYVDAYNQEFERYKREIKGILTDNVPVVVARDKGLSTSAKMVYGTVYTIIVQFGRKVISMPEINQRTHISQATIKRCVEQLERAGWLYVIRYTDEKGHKRNAYSLNTQQLIDRQAELLQENERKRASRKIPSIKMSLGNSQKLESLVSK